MGLISKAKREQMGLAQSVYGVLTDAMRISDGAEFQVARGIHCAARSYPPAAWC